MPLPKYVLIPTLELVEQFNTEYGHKFYPDPEDFPICAETDSICNTYWMSYDGAPCTPGPHWDEAVPYPFKPILELYF